MGYILRNVMTAFSSFLGKSQEGRRGKGRLLFVLSCLALAMLPSFVMAQATEDYGDAPASYGDASHTVPTSTTPTVFLGQIQPDTEVATQADDNAVGADEDALSSLPNLAANATRYSLNIPCEGNGAAVAGWMDLNGDGDFLDTGERAPTTGTGNL